MQARALGRLGGLGNGDATRGRARAGWRPPPAPARAGRGPVPGGRPPAPHRGGYGAPLRSLPESAAPSRSAPIPGCSAGGRGWGRGCVRSLAWLRHVRGAGRCGRGEPGQAVATALTYGWWRSVTTSSATTPVRSMAWQKNASAPAVTRRSRRSTSTTTPSSSIARYRYRFCPLRSRKTSSTVQHRPTARRRRRTSSASNGPNARTQSSTARRETSMPRSASSSRTCRLERG
jgi:hypothetical protein